MKNFNDWLETESLDERNTSSKIAYATNVRLYLAREGFFDDDRSEKQQRTILDDALESEAHVDTRDGAVAKQRDLLLKRLQADGLKSAVKHITQFMQRMG